MASHQGIVTVASHDVLSLVTATIEMVDKLQLIRVNYSGLLIPFNLHDVRTIINLHQYRPRGPVII